MRVWCFTLLLLAGCGYNTTGRSAANVGNLYIPFFADETSGERAPDLGTRLTQQLVLEFLRDKEIRVYQGEDERELAQKELLGTVRRLTEAVLTRSAEETEEEYRVVLTCSIQYTDVENGTVLWQDGGLFGDGNYRIEEGEPGFQRALEEAMDEVVDKILDKTVRAW
ncbi:MAG TPA: LPS assembly lipoprotein LptE [Candidatus Krumholzibacteria bacterium]|nr:LPS assembly lipoprotein LptE [Candidatus Krumholzibacteria bacterium]